MPRSVMRLNNHLVTEIEVGIVSRWTQLGEDISFVLEIALAGREPAIWGQVS